jgi:hypothetical protein
MLLTPPGKKEPSWWREYGWNSWVIPVLRDVANNSTNAKHRAFLDSQVEKDFRSASSAKGMDPSISSIIGRGDKPSSNSNESLLGKLYRESLNSKSKGSLGVNADTKKLEAGKVPPKANVVPSKASVVPSKANVHSAPKTSTSSDAQSKWSKWIPVGVAGVAGIGIGALIAYMIIRNRKKKRNKDNKGGSEKKAAWGDLTAGIKGSLARGIAVASNAFSDKPNKFTLVKLLNDIATADSREDYKSVNERLGKVIGGGIGAAEEAIDSGEVEIPDGKYFMWDRPVAYPSDKVNPINFKAPSWDQAVYKLLSGKSSERYPRAAPVAAMMAFMEPRSAIEILPDGTGSNGEYIPYQFLSADANFGKGYPSIGNMAYYAPAVLGQYAMDHNMSSNEVSKLTDVALDKMTIDAVKRELAKYPAVNNYLSAYVNGGFGDVRSPKDYGIKEPLYDYDAMAPTAAGSNAVMRAAEALAPVPEFSWEAKLKYPDGDHEKYRQKLYREGLRMFDELGPTLMPRTFLGKPMLSHPVGGLYSSAERAADAYLPYINNNPELLGAVLGRATGGLGNQVLNLMDKKMSENGESATPGSGR